MNIEQIKADREAGTQGEWFTLGRKVCGYYSGEYVGDGVVNVCEADISNARRIARVPDLEDFAIEAMAAMEAIVARSHYDPLGTSKVIDMRKIADAFLKKYTKPD